MRNKKTKRRSGVFFTTSIVLIFAVAYVCFFGISKIGDYHVKNFDEMIKRGLDLKGGVSVTEQIVSSVKDQATVDRTIKLLETRVNKLGVSETAVVQEGTDKIRIDIPGAKDTTAVLTEMSKSGKLEFRGPDKSIILTGSDVTDATAGLNQETGGFEINLTFSTDGTKKFADATEKFLGQNITIYLDEDQLSNATVKSVITQGKAQISGGTETLEQLTTTANLIKSGALPVTLKNISADVVGATLGENAYPQSIKAGVVGIAIVMLFMLLYYRVPGFIANIALLLFVLLVLGTFSSIGVVLSLSGIAGFLLTVGMAVDANVLIFERTKEELKSGKSIKTAINEGFKRAFTSILDSNMTTLITGVILYMFGSGSVKGFALTLIIGVLLSMFTAVVVTRQLMRWAADMGLFNNKASIGTFGVHDMRRGVQK